MKECVYDALNYFDVAFDTLFATANELNADVISIEDAKTQIRVLTSQIEDIKAVFYEKTQDIDKDEITEIKLALVTALALLDNVDFSKSRALVTSSLRYQLVQLVYCRIALLSNV